MALQIRSNNRTSYCTSGVTLLELAIVMIIIALLAGSIVTGKSLIRNATIREMLGEYDRYLSAIQEFQTKYNQLPGDFDNAEAFWGTDPNGCPFGTRGSAPQAATCNGDASGTIGSMVNPATGERDFSSFEWLRAWQHLANAKLISGLYSGTDGSLGAGVDEGIDAWLGNNVPASVLFPGGWMFYYYQQTSDTPALWGDDYGHLMFFGGTDEQGDGNEGTYKPVLTTAEALSIDTKMDDGKPGTGKIRSWRINSSAPDCTTNNGSKIGATYRTDYPLTACSLIFLMGF